jgi:hypothetical protein
VEGKPEIQQRDNFAAKVQIHVRLSYDMASWGEFQQSLRGVLTRISPKPFPYVSANNRYNPRHNYLCRFRRPLDKLWKYEDTLGKDPGAWIAVLGGIEKDGHESYQTGWKLFRVPASACVAFDAALKRKWKLHVALLDENDEPVVETEKELVYRGYGPPEPIGDLLLDEYRHNLRKNFSTYWLGPFPWVSKKGAYLPRYELKDVIIDVPTADLPRISKVAAFLKEFE